MGNHTPFLVRLGFNQAIHAGFHRGSQGVAILVRSRFPFQITKIWKDKLGRYVEASGDYQGTTLSVQCLYAPRHYWWSSLMSYN